MTVKQKKKKNEWAHYTEIVKELGEAVPAIFPTPTATVTAQARLWHLLTFESYSDACGNVMHTLHITLKISSMCHVVTYHTNPGEWINHLNVKNNYNVDILSHTHYILIHIIFNYDNGYLEFQKIST